jgi:Cu-processing system ATP-binding protein
VKRVALEGVSVRFGKLPALQGVDLAVSAGEALVLAGPNGAGKSTLLRVLLGLVRPDAGRLLVDGIERKVDNDLKRSVGYLPEAVAFAENLTARQVMSFFASARGVPRARVAEVLERVGLARAAGRAVRGYSRGMRQRLGLAVAVLSRPELLILDEPTGGLDQEGLSVLWSVVAEWRREGRMVLLASHELALLERRVDRICLLRAGAVRVVDTPGRLREIAALPVRVQFTLGDDEAQAESLVKCILETGNATDVERKEGALGVDVAPRELLHLLDLRTRYPNAVRGVRVEEPGLDMVYEHLLQEDG